MLSAPLASLVFIHMPCCLLTKVFEAYVVTFLSWTPIFEWYITRLVDKERQQEDIWDGEIGLYAQNIDNIFSPIVNIIGWVYMSISRERDLFILTSFDLFHNFNFNMTVCVLTKWPDSTVQFFVELKMPRIGLYSSYERGPFRGFEHASVRGGGGDDCKFWIWKSFEIFNDEKTTCIIIYWINIKLIWYIFIMTFKAWCLDTQSQ